MKVSFDSQEYKDYLKNKINDEVMDINSDEFKDELKYHHEHRKGQHEVQTLQDIVFFYNGNKENLAILNGEIPFINPRKYFRATGFEIEHECVTGVILANKKEMLIRDSNSRSNLIPIRPKLKVWAEMYEVETKSYLEDEDKLRVTIDFEAGVAQEHVVLPKDLYNVLKYHFEDRENENDEE